MFATIIFCISLFLSCDDGKISQFKHYTDIQKSDGIYTWPPTILPDAAEDIVIYTHVETNSFYVYFSLPIMQAEDFEQTLNIKVSKDGYDYISRNKEANNEAWCKLSALKQGGAAELYLISRIDSGKHHRYYLTHPRVDGEIPREDAVRNNMIKYCKVNQD